MVINSHNYNFNFSVIIAIYNTEEYLKEAIDSIISQDIGFEENIELILVNDGSSDGSEDICLEYKEKYPENIKYVYQDNQGQPSAHNKGIKMATGKYFNFLDSDDKISSETFSNILTFFDKHYENIDVVSIPMKFFDRREGDHHLNYKFKNTRVCNLLEEHTCVQLSIASSFVKGDIIKNMEFNTDLIISYDSLLLNEIVLNRKKIGLLKEGTYFYRKRNDLSSSIDKSRLNKKYYNHRLKNYLLKLINLSKDDNGTIPLYIQYVVMYELQFYFKESFLDILTEKEKDEFYSLITDILQYIDDKIILEQSNIKNDVKKEIFLFKYPKLDYIIENNNIRCFAGDTLLEELNKNFFYFDSIDLLDDSLEILGYFDSFLDENDYDIELIKYNKHSESIFKAEKVDYPFRDRIYLGKPHKIFYFKFNIPLSKRENSTIKIRLNYKNNHIYLDWKRKKYVKISEFSFYSNNDNYILLFNDNSLTLKNYNFLRHINLERKNIDHLKKLEENDEINTKIGIATIVKFRKNYLKSLFKFNRKEIWLFEDTANHADDNAESLYNYAKSQNDNIKKYFVISKDSKDYNRLKKSANVIEYKSMKHMYLYLTADKIISSSCVEKTLNPFLVRDYKFVASLLNIKKYYLQSGVTKDDVSREVTRFNRKLELITCSSKIEQDSFLGYNYNFDKEVINVLGLPRFDNLENNNQKQILFIPAWRRFIKNESRFLQSDYYNSLEDLLNDEDLMNFCRDNNYKFIFKPHPKSSEYLDLIKINDYVEISDDISYKELFNESSLLITDFSSTFFDFGYLKKPVLYYHQANDYPYESYFDYEAKGFGEVVYKEKELNRLIKSYIENGCVMKEKYSMRVEEFFEYIDKDNCKRVYEWIKEH